MQGILSGLIDSVLDFISDVFEAINNLMLWIGDLAVRIDSVELSTSGLTLILGNFRYLAGDVLYLTIVSSFYVGVFMIAFKCIPIVVSWWKHFLPTN